MMLKVHHGAILVVVAIVGFFIVIQRQKSLSTFRGHGLELEVWSDPETHKMFPFVPPRIRWCEILFEPKGEQTFPSRYNEVRTLFDTELLKVKNLLTITEGNIGNSPVQALTYSRLANLSFVRTVCETGFNAGHSALIWLSSNPQIHVYSFDLGGHEYSKPMAAFLQKTFPGRLNVTWGDSTVTLPAFTKKNPNFKCDMIVVDGGHIYHVTKADLINLRAHANKRKHLLLLDDYPVDTLPAVERAWKEEIYDKHVKEHWKCQFYYARYKGFTVGEFINL